jgi:hypothetical protein
MWKQVILYNKYLFHGSKFGQLGLGHKKPVEGIQKVTSVQDKIVTIHCGNNNAVFLTSTQLSNNHSNMKVNNELWVVGDNRFDNNFYANTKVTGNSV